MDDGQTQQHYPVRFTGRGGEFFKIWIVNILLTIVTLYIYSAWAKIRTKRYFYGNTLLDGSSFEYHAKPLQILLSRLVAAALFVAVTVGGSFNPLIPGIATAILFLIIPWAIWRSTKFNMRMSSYRNVRFGFDGSVWPLYLYQFLLPLLVYAVAGVGAYLWVEFSVGTPLIIAGVIVILVLNLLLTAYTHQRLSSYFLNHYLYGKSRFTGELALGSFFKTYLLATLLALGTLAALVTPLVISAVPEGAGVLEWLQSMFANIEEQGDEDARNAAAVFVMKLLLFFYAYVFVVGYFVVALISARIRNHVYRNAALDQRVTFLSTVTVAGLWWVMVSNLLLIIITLGLARPFTQVRMARFMAGHTAVVSASALDDFAGEKRQEVGAFGDELGDAFDMDMDVGF